MSWWWIVAVITWTVKACLIAAVIFGVVKRLISFVKQALEVRSIVATAAGCADADSRTDSMFMDPDIGLADDLAQTLSDLQRLILRGIGHQNGKFLAPVARHLIVRPRMLEQQLCHPDQDAVTCIMPPAVVDFLEMVQVSQ